MDVFGDSLYRPCIYGHFANTNTGAKGISAVGSPSSPILPSSAHFISQLFFHASSTRAADVRLPPEAPADLAGSWGAVLTLESSCPSSRRTNTPRQRARLPGQPPAPEYPDRFPACCEKKPGARAQFQAWHPLAIPRSALAFHLKFGDMPFKAAVCFRGLRTQTQLAVCTC